MPDTPPLDATARAALRAKAEEVIELRQLYKGAPHNGFSPSDVHAALDAAEEALDAAGSPDVILALLAAVERGAEDTEKLRAENANLWQIIRQKDRETYAAANSLDVAELDAMCCNLAIENAELREQVKRASHAATFMVE